MAVPGYPHDDVLVPHLERALAQAPPGLEWFDVHTHTGANDPDGTTGSAAELEIALDRAGTAKAAVFTTAEPRGYPPANDRVIAEAEAAAGRLVAFARLDPNAGDPIPEARRCLDAGARGFKLHPRSDAFVMSHPSVDALVALAGAEGLPVLVHAGRGIPALGEDLVHLAAAHPGAKIILAHAGISDLGLVARAARELPNLFFDTSWWQVADLLSLFALVRPSHILYASDIPYGSGRYATLAALRCAREVGLGPDAVAGIAGANARRLLAGDEPLDLGPAAGISALGPRWLTGERIASYTSWAVPTLYLGHAFDEALELARLACQPGEGQGDPALLDAIDGLLESALRTLRDDPGRARDAMYAALGAHVLAGTPRHGV